jgi:hypothetical protein
MIRRAPTAWRGIVSDAPNIHHGKRGTNSGHHPAQKPRNQLAARSTKDDFANPAISITPLRG